MARAGPDPAHRGEPFDHYRSPDPHRAHPRQPPEPRFGGAAFDRGTGCGCTVRGAAPRRCARLSGTRYELQDFNLYYVSRYGYRPSKIAFLAEHAWGAAERGDWPDAMTALERHAYDLPTIKKWLEVFLFRFVEQTQFKRSALPNGPKIGSGGSLSPRSDWRAPSDASARAWVEELRRNAP